MRQFTNPSRGLAVGLMLFSLALLNAGCNKETDVGGPGAAGTGGGVADYEGASADSFQLTMPDGEVALKAGETKTWTIGIERGENFNQKVDVTVMAPKEGITVEPSQGSFEGDMSEMEVKITAQAGAPAEKTSISVIGRPESGQSVDAAITVTVSED